jgi:phospholipase/carboxylesterase
MIISRRELLGAGLAAMLQSNAPRALGLESGRDGLLYVPSAYRPGVPMPLMLLLHGAGGTGSRMTGWFPAAEEFGVLVLAPDSRDERTWDAALGGWGPDLEFLARALRHVVGAYTVNQTRMCVAGFSDGASYALSFGIGAGDVFSHVAACSPGFMTPRDARGKPRIYISHGQSDQVLPIDRTSRRFVPALRTLGYDVTYHEYDGRHAVTDSIRREAFAWFLK